MFEPGALLFEHLLSEGLTTTNGRTTPAHTKRISRAFLSATWHPLLQSSTCLLSGGCSALAWTAHECHYRTSEQGPLISLLLLLSLFRLGDPLGKDLGLPKTHIGKHSLLGGGQLRLLEVHLGTGIQRERERAQRQNIFASGLLNHLGMLDYRLDTCTEGMTFKLIHSATVAEPDFSSKPT